MTALAWVGIALLVIFAGMLAVSWLFVVVTSNPVTVLLVACAVVGMLGLS